MEPLERVLRDFGERVNAHPRLRSLLNGWDRIAAVAATDTDKTFVVRFRGSKIVTIDAHPAPDELDLSIRGSEHTLVSVFSGHENPTTLFLEGTLQVFASDMDQVKLDAITMVLWD